MPPISKVIRDGRGFFRMLTGLEMDGQTLDPTAPLPAAGLLYYRSDLKRLRMMDDAGVFANLAREDGGNFAMISGSGAAPTVVVGNSAQMGTGPSASIAGSPMSMILTFTPGTTPTIFTANTPIVIATITLPAGLLAAAPNNVSVDGANQQAAQDETGTNGLAYYYDKASSTATSIVVKAVSKGTPTLTNAVYLLSLGVIG